MQCMCGGDSYGQISLRTLTAVVLSIEGFEDLQVFQVLTPP